MTSIVYSFLLQCNHSFQMTADPAAETYGTWSISRVYVLLSLYYPTTRSLKVYNGSRHFSDKQRRYLQSHLRTPNYRTKLTRNTYLSAAPTTATHRLVVCRAQIIHTAVGDRSFFSGNHRGISASPPLSIISQT